MDTQTNDMDAQGLEELILVTLIQKFLPFMETEGPLQCSTLHTGWELC
jgi:hypothetical protein